MTCIIDTQSKRRLSARLATGVALSLCMVFGAFVSTASADDDHHDRGEHRGWDHRGERSRSGWSGGYYTAPPVVYGSPYGYRYGYGYPPPVVYGPSVGISVPGLSIGIR